MAVGLVALSLVGEGLTEAAAMPPGFDTHAVAAPAVRSPELTGTITAQPTAPSTQAPIAAERRLTTEGGYVVARCESAQAYLVYWSPAQGYRAEDVQRGPTETASLHFTGASREIEVKITCLAGEPRLSVEEEDEDEH